MWMRFNLDEKHRHYKKDSRFVMDLYTITYDTHEKVENLPEIHDIHKRRSSDREEIRKRLASGGGGGLLEKPVEFNLNVPITTTTAKSITSTSSTLNSNNSSSNLQVCFMNEAARDCDDDEEDEDDDNNRQFQSLPCFDLSAPGPGGGGHKHNFINFTPSSSLYCYEEEEEDQNEDFFMKMAKLQGEARNNLKEAKELVKFQLKQEKLLKPNSPVIEMVSSSFSKAVGKPTGTTGSLLTPKLLSSLNLAQLEVIANDMHSHIENLNESLVELLVERDDLQMEQDSMLTDIEDLSRYLAAKHCGGNNIASSSSSSSAANNHQSLPIMNMNAVMMMANPSETILGKKKRKTQDKLMGIGK